MSAERSLVQNAADKKQVEHAGRKEKRQRERDLDHIRAVLKTYDGRAVLWGFISYCGIYREPVDPRGDNQQRLIGMQRVGLYMIAEIEEASEDAYEMMKREAKQRRRNEQVEAEAVRTKSADPSKQDDD